MSDVDNDGESWTPRGEYVCEFDGTYCARCQLYGRQNDCQNLT